jgi:hypothetical protein
MGFFLLFPLLLRSLFPRSIRAIYLWLKDLLGLRLAPRNNRLLDLATCMTRAYSRVHLSLDPGVLPLANVTLQVGSLRRFSFMNFACALIRGALQVGYTDLSFSRKTSLYFIMPIPLTARISISDPALLPICHLQKVRTWSSILQWNNYFIEFWFINLVLPLSRASVVCPDWRSDTTPSLSSPAS